MGIPWPFLLGASHTSLQELTPTIRPKTDTIPLSSSPVCPRYQESQKSSPLPHRMSSTFQNYWSRSSSAQRMHSPSCACNEQTEYSETLSKALQVSNAFSSRQPSQTRSSYSSQSQTSSSQLLIPMCIRSSVARLYRTTWATHSHSTHYYSRVPDVPRSATPRARTSYKIRITSSYASNWKVLAQQTNPSRLHTVVAC